MQNKYLFSRKLFPTTWISLFLSALLFPLGVSLPAWWGWENGPIENTQVVILSAGAFLSWLAARRKDEDRKVHNLWLWMIPVWLVLAGRELSWGRVFFDPVAIGAKGPAFPAIQDIWYGPYCYPVLTVIIISTLLGLWRNFDWEHIKPGLRVAVVDVSLLILAALASQLVFEKNLVAALSAHSQMLEELSELLVYWCMVSLIAVNVPGSPGR